MKTIFHLPASLEEDLSKFKEETERFRTGAISVAEFRAFRVPQGVYEQREAGAFMLRVRLAAGGVLPHQMKTLASVARNYGNGILHVTTRQDIQVHQVALERIHPALLELYAAGLSTKGGGGNTVRNITACYDAGVCPREAFDVAPYAVAATEFLLPDPLSFQLPRKYKIAFSGCGKDCAGATVNDLGFIAKRCDDTPGFAVYVGGGMGAYSRVADLLGEFVPASEFHLVAEAVKRVFDRHANRRNRHKARLRFLIDRIGLDSFRQLYQEELDELRKASPACPAIRPLTPAEPAPPGKSPSRPAAEGFAAWQEHNLLPQKQEGFYLVQIPLFLGDLDAGAMDSLADIVEAHGEGMLRTTQWQNVVLRWVAEGELAELHAQLSHLGLADSPPPVVRDLVACTGASTCKLGICLSRGLAKAIGDELSRTGLALDGLNDLKVHISGCPNACGRHPIAPMGFFGAARRVGGRLVPHYVLQLGGRTEEGRTTLASGKQAIPARNVPRFLTHLLTGFLASPDCPDFEAFLKGGGRALADRLACEYGDVPDFETDKNCYFDWGAKEMFSLAGRGPGECGAGVFDLIEVDLAGAAEALAHGRHVAAAALAARALLVTQGEQPDTDSEAFRLFRKHFLETGLIDRSLEGVMAEAARSAGAADPEQAFSSDPDEVASLVAAVKHLYDTMDPSLRFFAANAPAEPAPADDAPAEPTADSTQDFRGVVCPLNYVKTKMALAPMEPGQTLLVLLDDEGARNVPTSVEQDGHQVLSTTREGDHYKLLIRKKA